ncbi:hypothetical protein HKD27_05995 [Gluconobacter sp. R75690]|uniref:hypothetical protein n=1 Tax=unclassified Gluconobacter TaxID=2644261 RepID=UPI00188D06C1|nr:MULTISPECIES: hypothetical protein [unclassified Gluconobacter]MBF0850476.1 hypothetical protein [Gluconobacter sp. R75690]MBF0879168.1 hypothetical protein [Gluconobacter sp. R75828]
MKAESIRQAEILCERLRARGDDDLCKEAAAEIEGTLVAFAALAETVEDLRERLKSALKNLDSTNRLFARVPLAARLEAAHGKKVETPK